MVFRRILLTLDGSELARRAIPPLRDMALEDNSQVCLLQVVDTLNDVRHELGNGDGQARSQLEQRAADLHRLRHEEAERELEAARHGLRDAGVRSVTKFIREGHPAETIVATAAELDCDAIVMGARGHSGMQREEIGGVAASVVMNAAVAAVLLVGPHVAGTRGPQSFSTRVVSAAPRPPPAEVGG
jgi:nucleotide-binding universal stress UspA family protein